MKRSLLLIFAILLSVTGMAQNILVSESFDGSSLPEGWSIKGNGTSNWSVSETRKSGGSANEMKLTWPPEFNGTSRLVTPAVDLSGITQVTIDFKHYIDHGSGSVTLGVATSSDDGTTWNTGWSQTYSSSGRHNIIESIITPDMGQPNVKLCVFFQGSSFNIDDWYFDDIVVFSQNNLDLEIVTIDTDNVLEVGDAPVIFTVINGGETTITTIEANYQLDDSDTVTETFDVNIESLASQTLTFETPITLSEPGTSYSLTVNISTVNGQEDANADNNTMTKTLATSFGTTQKIPMIEHFSSSTCGPCVDVNAAMLALTENNPGKYAYVKYAMYWPGLGDPYYTAEGGARANYYGDITGVPRVKLDGTITIRPIPQDTLDQQYNTPAFAEIKGAFNVDGNNITVTADIMSYAEMNDVRAFVSVNEKTTTDNVGTNGETEFHHIMMKMLPDAQGSTISINAGEYTRLEFTYDMSTTFVEEMDDLEVAVWLQNQDTKEIYNSRFLYEYTDHPYPVQNLQSTDNGDNTATISWEAPEAGNPTGYNVYLNSELVAENISDLEYTLTSDSRDYYLAEVCANYGEDKTSVKAIIEFTITVGIEDIIVENHCNIYPNPANSHVNIVNNTEISTISIFNCVGALVDRIEVSGNSFELNTSKYDTGVYFMNVMNVNGHSSNKKLVINH